MTRAWMALAALAVTASRAAAHSFDPALLDLRERDAGIYDVIWKTTVPEGSAVRQPGPVFGHAVRPPGAPAAGSVRAWEPGGRHAVPRTGTGVAPALPSGAVVLQMTS